MKTNASPDVSMNGTGSNVSLLLEGCFSCRCNVTGVDVSALASYMVYNLWLIVEYSSSLVDVVL